MRMRGQLSTMVTRSLDRTDSCDGFPYAVQQTPVLPSTSSSSQPQPQRMSRLSDEQVTTSALMYVGVSTKRVSNGGCLAAGGAVGGGCAVAGGSGVGSVGNRGGRSIGVRAVLQRTVSATANDASAIIVSACGTSGSNTTATLTTTTTSSITPATNHGCARCRNDLGKIVNRGAACRLCGLRVCKQCREFNTHTLEWMCCVCFHRQT